VKRLIYIVLVISFIVSFAIAIAYGDNVVICKKRPSAPKADLTVEDTWWQGVADEFDPCIWYTVNGVVVNNSDSVYKNVKISVSIYDARTGNKLRDAKDKTESLYPGEKWQFNAIPAVAINKQSRRGEVYRKYSYRVVELTGNKQESAKQEGKSDEK
jgi:hypothetical protein